LKEFIPRHPGGSLWFARSNGRDISAALFAYHENPSKQLKIIEQYEVKNTSVHDATDPLLNVPRFIIPETFNAHTDTLRFDWNKKDSFLDKVKAKINTEEQVKRRKQCTDLFDLIALVLLFIHMLMTFVGIYYEVLPIWAFTIFFVMTRTSMAAVGHYHCHRKKDGIVDWGDSLFDMQYVGACIILTDGHVMLHHLYTNSPADVKRTVFTAMLDLPRLWRVPIYTLQRFG
jgi:hypothetical protein